MSKFNLLTVKEVKKETPNSVSILFEIPEQLKDAYQFIAGQYVNIKYKKQEKEVRRAYSICSTPKSGDLRVAVKKVDDGLFSPYANTRLKAGDQLEVQVPEGRFTLETQVDNHAGNVYS
jgi:ring-1,2-phenylacetyl-CoA epoxidase subunit PaaE